ncbi:hypothetical protein JN086_24390 [Mycolicibacterium austroafricanum]|uniref:PASTA domain-containing protein n=1 Tax=Mycolicibacterium austroafricanum TaxID=39687 RepID=A0ABT8HGX5_MYCAO|nr:hypothetical protein [Mycolicibacterium austroafricanum]MDN4520019.1 hypothetical protein [Mycolicibacterium austroafricanum]QRZ06101.1 hypothetical protein JN090_24860 [Mycolicibacterium austroafricanum]QZT67586.1 hypothetical protein JN086_24390 [Mycolicibacterium austroafricanum]
MARLPYFAALTLAGGLIASAVTAPTAFTQPPAPVAGSESPGDTIRELTNQGFDVQINWVAGQPSNIPLSRCTVTRIDTSAPPTAWVSINCPPDGSQ